MCPRQKVFVHNNLPNHGSNKTNGSSHIYFLIGFWWVFGFPAGTARSDTPFKPSYWTAPRKFAACSQQAMVRGETSDNFAECTPFLRLRLVAPRWRNSGVKSPRVTGRTTAWISVESNNNVVKPDETGTQHSETNKKTKNQQILMSTFLWKLGQIWFHQFSVFILHFVCTNNKHQQTMKKNTKIIKIINFKSFHKFL